MNVGKVIPAMKALHDFCQRPAEDARPLPQPAAPASDRRARPDMKKLLRAAYMTGRRKEARMAQKRLQQALRTLAETHENQLQAERVRWQQDMAEQMIAHLQQGLARLEERVRATLAETLAPVLERTARDRAVDAFARMLRAHLKERQGIVMEVTGPPAMLEGLRQALGEGATAGVRLVPAPEQVELSVWIDETVLTTCVAEWARKYLLEDGR